MARVDVMTGPERRRRWSWEQKRAMVEAAFAPGSVVREAARRLDVGSNQLYRWRRELQDRAGGGFAPVMVLPDHHQPAERAVADSGAMIEIELAGSARVRLPAATPPELAAAILSALVRP